jgi:hypothetical protein
VPTKKVDLEVDLFETELNKKKHKSESDEIAPVLCFISLSFGNLAVVV